MKILLVGNGGREHAMCRALATARPTPTLLIAPGNPGTATLGRNIAMSVGDIDAICRFAQQEAVDLLIPGPEAPLVAGLTDAAVAAGIPCCGPSKAAAALEGSKAFTRELTSAVGVPTPRFVIVDSPGDLADALASWSHVPVLKADGLAGGKGVFLPESLEDCLTVGRRLLDGALGDAGRTVVIEDREEGVEASVFFACHGRDAVLLPHARDHKRLGDGDVGPNTGGMGAISPNPQLDPLLLQRVRTQIVDPTLQALAARGTPFVGFLYVGLMLTSRGPVLIEFNVRLGDPEAQAILPRLGDGDFAALCLATARGTLASLRLREDPRHTCAVVLAAAGYPDKPQRGDVVTADGLFDGGLFHDDVWLIHAGTAPQARPNGTALVTAAGRVLTVVGRGTSAQQARDQAYKGVARVRFDGMQHRRDIGAALGSHKFSTGCIP